MHLGLISTDIPATSTWAQQQGFTVLDATGRVVSADYCYYYYRHKWRDRRHRI